MTSTDQRFADLLRIVDGLRELSFKFLGSNEIDDISLSVPNLPLNELYFRKLVSWSYVLLYESGYFIGYSRKLLRLNPAESEEFNKIRRVINNIRTFNEHNLRNDRAADVKKIKEVESWMLEHGGNPNDWKKCSIALLEQLCKALTAIHVIWEQVCETKNQCCEIRRGYISEKNTNWEAHQFDPFIQEAASEIGLAEFDGKKYRDSGGRLERWRKLVVCFNNRVDAENAIKRAIRTELINLFGEQ